MLDNITDVPQDLSASTSNSNAEDVTRNAGGISGGTTVATSYFRDAANVTSPEGITDRISTNGTIEQYASKLALFIFQEYLKDCEKYREK